MVKQKKQKKKNNNKDPGATVKDCLQPSSGTKKKMKPQN